MNGATDEGFLRALRELSAPRMGTELVGPLLYSLVRSTRPARVLEIGSGATTLYLLRALADNVLDVRRELALMGEKQRQYDPRWNDEEVARENAPAIIRWLEKEPSLALPEFYHRPYRPSLISVDNDSSSYSSSARVYQAAESAGLAGYLTRKNCDFREVAQVTRSAQHLDFAWFDCGGYQDYRDFLDLYWDHVEPRSGLLVLHYTLTVPSHERVLAELAGQRDTGKLGRFEMLSLLEPHKIMQNSLTLIRRCNGDPPRFPLTRPISLERTSS